MNYITFRRQELRPYKYWNTTLKPFRNYTKPSEAMWKPSADITETEDVYIVHAELPGVSKDDVRITVLDNELTITGEKAHVDTDEAKYYRQKENRYGSFKRRFSLPPKVALDKIDAEFRDGLLTLTIPKPEESKPREISIETDSSGE